MLDGDFYCANCGRAKIADGVETCRTCRKSSPMPLGRRYKPRKEKSCSMRKNHPEE